jgi:hypothetical protein
MKKNVFASLLCFCVSLVSYASDADLYGAPHPSYDIQVSETEDMAVTDAAPPAVAQGDDEAEDVPIEPVNIQLVPGIGTTGFNHKATNYMLIGILGGLGYNLRGFGFGLGLSNTGSVYGMQLSGLFNLVREDVHGAQIAGVFNVVRGSVAGIEKAGVFNLVQKDMQGVQAAGVFNIVGGSAVGFQLAGIFNWNRESFRGLQIGLVNYDGGDGDSSGARIGLVNISKSENVIPVGLVNIVENGLMHPAIWYDDLGFVNLSLKSGSKYFYSILGLGVNDDLLFDGDYIFVARTGIGAELPLNKIFLNLDLTAGQIIFNWPWAEENSTSFIAQARLSAGYKVFKHLGVFAGISYDYILSSRDSPKPGKDFGLSFLTWNNGRHTHKIGFFGGIQF